MLILQQEIEKEKYNKEQIKMEKEKDKGNCRNRCFSGFDFSGSCVNVYLKEKQNTQNTKYTEAQEEKKQLEEKKKALKEKQAEAENAENTTQEQQDSDEAGEPVDETEEDADSEESLTEEQLAEEDAPDLEAIRASVEEKLQGTDEFGEAWQIYVYRLKDGARASLGQED